MDSITFYFILLLSALPVLLIGKIWFLIVLWLKNPTWGLLCLMVPPLSFLFLRTCWRESKGATTFFVVGYTTCVFAIGGILVSAPALSGPPNPAALLDSEVVPLGNEAVVLSSEIAEPPVFVDLPEEWVARTSSAETVQQAADQRMLDAHFTLAIQPRSQFDDDLVSFAEATQQATRKLTNLTNRSETNLRVSQIGHHHVVSYEINGESGSYVWRSRVVMLKIGDWFCKLFFWTTPENWNAAQPTFEEIVERIQLRSNNETDE